MYIRRIKPVLDVAFGVVVAIAFLPFFLFIVAIIFIVTKDNPLFIQKRVGQHGKLFSVVKFKTMTDKTDLHGNLLPDEQRETKIGNFMRRTSIDEFPQIINVLKGDMSLVGPRPWISEQLKGFPPRVLARRYEVKPGMTGLAQVCGRNDISFEKRMVYDIYYIKNCSFINDIFILGKTIIKVLKMEGAKQNSNPQI